jgi:hypothetical protein
MLQKYVDSTDTSGDNSAFDVQISKAEDHIEDAPKVTRHMYTDIKDRLEAQAKKKFPETNSSDSSLAGLINSSSNSPGVAAIFSELTGPYGINDDSAMLVFTKGKCAKCNGVGHQHKDCPSIDHEFDAKVSSKRDNGTSGKQQNVDRNVEYRHDPDSSAPPAQQDSNRKKRTKRAPAKGVGADGTAKRKIYGPASWTEGMDLCSNIINGVECKKKHLRRLCPPKLAADATADATVDDTAVGMVTTYVAVMTVSPRSRSKSMSLMCSFTRCSAYPMSQCLRSSLLRLRHCCAYAYIRLGCGYIHQHAAHASDGNLGGPFCGARIKRGGGRRRRSVPAYGGQRWRSARRMDHGTHRVLSQQPALPRYRQHYGRRIHGGDCSRDWFFFYS